MPKGGLVSVSKGCQALSSGSLRWFSLQKGGYPDDGGIPPGKNPADIMPPGGPIRDPDLPPPIDQDIYPPGGGPHQPDTDRTQRDGDFPHIPRYPSPDTNPADQPHIPEPPTPGIDPFR